MSPTTTFIHTGDEHLDAETHGSINAATGRNTLWESNFRVLRHLAEQAAEKKVDFFLSCGDNFKGAKPSPEAMLMFADALAPLGEAGIEYVNFTGNHQKNGLPTDHRTVTPVIADLLRARGIKVHFAETPELIRLESGTQIAALPWLSKNRVLAQLDASDLNPAEGDLRVSQYAIAELERLAAEADPSAPLIMASHITVDSMRIDAIQDGLKRGSETELAHVFSEPILPVAAVRDLPFQYGALSHIHTPQKVGGNLYYAGSPNRLTFTDMPDIKGGNLVTLNGGTADVEKILTPAREMVRIDMDDEGHRDAIGNLHPGTLVQVLLPTGSVSLPPEFRKAITETGAVLADTKVRPKPRETVESVHLPNDHDPKTALRLWFERNPIAGLTVEQLLAAAESLEA